MEIQSTLEERRVAKEVVNFDDLGPNKINCELHKTTVEEPKIFAVDSRDPSKSLLVGTDLPMEAKEKLKYFLHDNLNIFAWKYEDMVGIDSKVNCHHLKIDPEATPYRYK